MEKDKYHHGDLKQALIKSGMKILKEEGVNALTLRSAARAAGVSHSAPYSHFADKQALLAAISTMGFNDLYDRITTTVMEFRNSPRELLTETGWTYIQFAVSETNCFKLMFSGILEDEHSYPEFMAAVQKTYQKLVDVVVICQEGKVLRSGPQEENAIAVWSLVHGFVSLYLEQQLPGRVLEKYQLKKLLINTLRQLQTT
jgi:AcrR family transcriptional regulator